MYDIHCHVLSDVDDGAEDIEDSLEICRACAKEGVRAIIATPHFIEGVSDIEESKVLSQIFLLSQELKSEDIEICVLPGMEVYICPNLLQLYEEGKIIPLNNKNYMLIELPMHDVLPPYLDEILFNLQIKGIRPIIAHPERYSAVIKHPKLVCKLINNGCIIQVNAGSIDGLYGRVVRKSAYTLLNHNMVHVIASDIHSSYRKMSSLKECYKAICNKFGKSKADDLFITNPQLIMNGQGLNVEEPLKIKKGFWIFK